MRLNLKAYVPEINKTVTVMGYHPQNNSVYLSTVHLFGTEGDDVLMFCGSEPDQVKLRVSTGLKDKNGVEIYEGDIVRIGTLHGDQLGSIVWDAEYAQYEIKDNERYQFGGEYVTSRHTRHFKVVGNIYENPELLGESTQAA